MSEQHPQQHKPRELVPITMRHGMMQPQSVNEAIELAKFIAHSGMVPKTYEGKPGAVLVAMQMGAELGLAPMASLQNIAVINGRPSIWGDAMLAIIQGHSECEDVAETFDDSTMTATCTVKRRGRSAVVRKFSQKDASTAGLWSKSGPWSQYPKRMLQLRARGFALRDSFPDALRGISLAEEARDKDRDVVDQEAAWVDDSEAPQPGVYSFRGDNGKTQPAPSPAPAVETAHEAPAPEPVEAQVPKPAAPPREIRKVPTPEKPPEAQQGLGW